MWNSLYTQMRIRDAIMFCLNSPRTNAHQIVCHHHHSRCAHQTPTQAQITNPTSHLHALPAVILRTLYSTVVNCSIGTLQRQRTSRLQLWYGYVSLLTCYCSQTVVFLSVDHKFTQMHWRVVVHGFVSEYK